MNQSWIIRGGRVIDPATGRDETADLFVRDGRIAETAAKLPESVPVYDATGQVVCPGLWDIHVHFREPGREAAETIASGCRAALRGGFTTVVTMPNTTPPVDTPARVRDVPRRGDACTAPIQVLPSACVTVGRRGRELADLDAMAAAGAVAFTDDGSNVADEALLSQAMQRAAALNRPIMDHALDPVAAGHGVMHAGRKAALLGVPGIPSEAETLAVSRDIRMAERTGCAVHIQHVSAAESIRLIRDAQQRGIRVSGEATPHHLALTEDDIPGDDADYKMNPPLRTEEDRAALVAGVLDGTLQALATDHAPHTAADKARGFRGAPFGVVGLETAVAVTLTVLVKRAGMPIADWVARWTTGPAAILGLPAPSLAPGCPANICILNPSAETIVDRSAFVSRSRNTPFHGRTFSGRVIRTLYRGIDTMNHF